MLVSACGSGPTNPTAPTATANFQPTVPAGMQVLANRQGQWLPATVVRQTSATSVVVHYDGTPAEWDEDVPFERVKAREAQPAQTLYRPGELVLAQAQNRLYAAEIVQQVDARTYRIHYAGYGPETVENATIDRLQRQFAGQTQYPVGSALLVNVGQAAPMPAKVIAVVAADQWVVRFDGLTAQYDQLVGANRVMPPATAAAPTATPTTAPTAAPTTAPTAAPAVTGTAKTAPPKPEVAAPAPLKVGDAVLVLTRNLYYPAKINAAGATANVWRVRVEGQTADEDVQADRVVRLPDPLKGVKYKAGQLVFIEWHGVYAPGKVVKEADSGNYKVRVDGATPDADEIVPVKRLRPR
ncbi:MAG: hypothetical protein IPK82_08710 [Polyangiaceae bacterium]|nr:hypothetical protein [Polyangiaceae bacterium]